MYSSNKRATDASEVKRDKKGDNIIVLKGNKGKTRRGRSNGKGMGFQVGNGETRGRYNNKGF